MALLVALACMLAPQAGRADAGACVFDIKGLSYDEQLMVLALQGLANRAGPKLFLETSSINWPNPEADGIWRDYYAQRKGITFETVEGLPELLTRFSTAYRGVVVYDPARDASRYVALTLAGLDDALPVTPELQGREPLRSAPVLHDLRGRFPDDLAAYNWAIEALFPRCDQTAVYSAGRSHDDTILGGDGSVQLAADYGVAQRMFFFNLSFTPDPTRWSGQDLPGYPDQVALVDRILDLPTKPGAVWGWCEPEGHFAHRVSAHNDFVVCGAAPNLSFHMGVPASRERFAQARHITAADVTLEEKTYVTVLTNEGDTPKAICSEYLRGWREAERGGIAMNWLVNPHLLKLFPSVAEYYYDSATPADYFECAVSGAGYTILSALPEAETFGRWTAEYLPWADLRFIDVWTDRFEPEALRRYADLTGVRGFTLEGPGPRSISFAGEFPISRTGEQLGYWGGRFKTLEALAGQVRAIAAETPRPNFVQIYSGTSPRQFVALRGLLGEGFEFVRLDEYVSLAERASLLQIDPPTLYAARGARFRAEVAARTLGEAGPVTISLDGADALHVDDARQATTVRPGEASRLAVAGAVDGDAIPGRYTLQATDSRGNVARAQVVVPELGFEDAMGPAEAWQGWGASPAGIEVRDGRAVITERPGGLPYSAIERKVTVDVTRYPTLLVDVPRCEHAWAVKVRPADSMTDTVLIADTADTGTLAGDLGRTGWTGEQTFYVIVFVIGEGKTMELGGLRFVRLPAEG